MPSEVNLQPGWLARDVRRSAERVFALRRRNTMSVIDEIVAERRRQIDVEGWTAEHDDTHAWGELAYAAACYAEGRMRACWPWESAWWKPKSRRRALIKAAALIVAEIERIDRNQ